LDGSITYNPGWRQKVYQYLIAEMLIQNHEGYIDLLPAIPDQWKITGEITGLRARGNFIVDMKWKKGKVTQYRILSARPRKIKIMVNGGIKTSYG
jgi:alpha-L-fucosidase 2